MNKNIDIVFTIAGVNTKLLKTLDGQLSIHGISFSEFFVMYQLASTESKMMRRVDLAEKVSMSASGITRLLNPMEKLKIVEKEPNPRDARVSFVKLTSAGMELFDNALQSVNYTADTLFEDLEIEDITKLFEILKKLR